MRRQLNNVTQSNFSIKGGRLGPGEQEGGLLYKQEGALKSEILKRTPERY